MAISVIAVYERGVFRPLEQLSLPEKQKYQISIQPIPEKKPVWPIQEALADVLGFDPSDEEKLRELAERQYEAVMEIAGTGHSGLSDISRNVDKYLYAKDW